MKKILRTLLTVLLSVLLIVNVCSCSLFELTSGSDTEDDATTRKKSSTRTSDDEEYDEEEETDEEDEDDETTTFEEEERIYKLTQPKICNAYGDRKGIINMTFDDGYNMDSAWFVSDTLKQYNYRASTMCSVCFVETNVEEWREILDEGVFSVSSHGYTHATDLTKFSASNPDAKMIEEIKTAQEKLRELFPGQRVLTYATPGGHANAEAKTELSKYYIGNREGNIGSTPTKTQLASGNAYDMNCVIIGSEDQTATDLNNAIDRCMKTTNPWAICLYHEIMDNPSWNLCVKKTVFAEHVKHIYDTYGDTVWVCSYEDACLYKREQSCASVTSEMTDGKTVSVKLTDTLDNSIYNHPLTCKVYLPKIMTKASIVKDGKTVALEIKQENGINFVYVDIVPDSGEFIINVSDK